MNFKFPGKVAKFLPLFFRLQQFLKKKLFFFPLFKLTFISGLLAFSCVCVYEEVLLQVFCSTKQRKKKLFSSWHFQKTYVEFSIPFSLSEVSNVGTWAHKEKLKRTLRENNVFQGRDKEKVGRNWCLLLGTAKLFFQLSNNFSGLNILPFLSEVPECFELGRGISAGTFPAHDTSFAKQPDR